MTGASPRRCVVLLVRNAESVVRAAGDCGTGLAPELLARALAKKLNERDIVLKRVADGPRPVRDCVAKRVPSLAELRDRIRCALGA